MTFSVLAVITGGGALSPHSAARQALQRPAGGRLCRVSAVWHHPAEHRLNPGMKIVLPLTVEDLAASQIWWGVVQGVLEGTSSLWVGLAVQFHSTPGEFYGLLQTARQPTLTLLPVYLLPPNTPVHTLASLKFLPLVIYGI